MNAISRFRALYWIAHSIWLGWLLPHVPLAGAERESGPPPAPASDWSAIYERHPGWTPGKPWVGDVADLQALELQRLQERKRGLDFWQNHSEDPRRYEWLLRSVGMPPHYWLSP